MNSPCANRVDPPAAPAPAPTVVVVVVVATIPPAAFDELASMLHNARCHATRGKEIQYNTTALSDHSLSFARTPPAQNDGAPFGVSWLDNGTSDGQWVSTSCLEAGTPNSVGVRRGLPVAHCTCMWSH